MQGQQTLTESTLTEVGGITVGLYTAEVTLPNEVMNHVSIIRNYESRFNHKKLLNKYDEIDNVTKSCI